MARLKLTLGELLARFEGAASVEGATFVLGTSDAQAGALARVLEYGSVAGQPPWPGPGPRTVLAVNPETGAQVVVSAQAPQGYIRVRVPHFVALLRGHLPGPIDWLDAAAMEAHVREAGRAAAADALETLRSGVPADSGRLRDSLTMAAD
jgi:hypothetical protein